MIKVTQTANNLVYEKLRSQILVGYLLPGEWLREHDLVDQFKVSRTPIREALRRLESEQLIEIIPYRGACIVKPDAEAIREDYIVRAALEGLAIELAVPHIDEQTMLELEAMVDQMEDLLKSLDLQHFLEINQRFHMTIYNCSGTQRLLIMIQEAWDRDNLYRILFLSRWPASLQIEKRIHRDLLDAIRANDDIRARSLMQQSFFEMCALINDDE